MLQRSGRILWGMEVSLASAFPDETHKLALDAQPARLPLE
jgi:hypothetical protein